MKWYASAPSTGILLTGPHDDQAAAYKAMRLTAEAQVELNRIWPPDLQVWPDDRSTNEILNEKEKDKVREHQFHRKMTQPAYDIVTRRR